MGSALTESDRSSPRTPFVEGLTSRRATRTREDPSAARRGLGPLVSGSGLAAPFTRTGGAGPPQNSRTAGMSAWFRSSGGGGNDHNSSGGRGVSGTASSFRLLPQG